MQFFSSFFSLSKNVKSSKKSEIKYAPKRRNYKHFIHPAYKKRSIDELTPLQKFDLNLHRNSRHALYKQINTFLQTYVTFQFLDGKYKRI